MYLYYSFIDTRIFSFTKHENPKPNESYLIQNKKTKSNESYGVLPVSWFL